MSQNTIVVLTLIFALLVISVAIWALQGLIWLAISKKCPACAERIKGGARKCRYCGEAV